MERLLLYLFTLFVSACAARQPAPVVVPPTVGVNVDGVMSLIHADRIAHACPVMNTDGDTENGTVYTAGHVAGYENKDGNMVYHKYVWADFKDNTGIAEGSRISPYRDLGVMKIQNGSPQVYYYRAEAVEIGDTVYWVQYKEDSEALLSEVKEAKVTYKIAGYVVFDGAPARGASGSCLFNSASEVVGVVVWRMKKGTHESGAAALLLRSY